MMNEQIRKCMLPVFAFAIACGFALPAPHAAAQNLAVHGKTVHTMAGEAIADGVVIVRDGKIAAVGPATEINIPDGFRVLDAAVVTPGLIDAHGTVGVSGLYNTSHDQDQLEHSDPIQPELRALDAYNPQEKLVEYVRRFGITTVHTGHAPGELISGQTVIVKTTGVTADEAAIVPVAAVAATIDPAAQKGGGKSPGTRGKMMAMLRSELIEAREYKRERDEAQDNGDARDDADANADADDTGGDAPGNAGADAGGDDGDSKQSPGRSLRKEMLVKVLDGELPLLITANRAQDIASALRLAEEFKIRIWLDSAAEAYLLIDAIKAAGVPVIIHPSMYRAYGTTENMSFETAAKLREAGIPVALQSGFEDYVPKTRIVLFEAAIAAANGLSFEQALATITIDAARILGVDDRIGSIEPGKDGDLALYDGDPFEYTSHCTAAIINGEVVSEGTR